MEFCEEMANLGKTIIVAALDGTFQRKVTVCVCLHTSEFILTDRLCVHAAGADRAPL